MKEAQDTKLLTITGTILGVAIVGAVVCGILECFGINTGWFGGVCACIPGLFLVVFILWQIIKDVTK